MVEDAVSLAFGGALLRLERVFVLRLAADVVARGDDLGGLQHRHVGLRQVFDEPGVARPERVGMLVLDQRDRLGAGAHGHLHVVADDLLGGDRHGHQPGGALPVDGLAGDAGRHAGAQQRLPGEIGPGRALLHRRAHDEIVNLDGIDLGALDRGLDGVRGERLRLHIVEGAAIGLANRSAGG